MHSKVSANNVEAISKRERNNFMATSSEANGGKVPATVIQNGEVNKDDVIKRKDGRITNVFEFNEENVVKGRYEQFEKLGDMVLHFIKSYKDKPLTDYIKVVQRPDRKPYETLRIPKSVQEACYTKLKTFMVIEETQISARKIQYYVKEVYDRAEILNR